MVVARFVPIVTCELAYQQNTVFMKQNSSELHSLKHWRWKYRIDIIPEWEIKECGLCEEVEDTF